MGDKSTWNLVRRIWGDEIAGKHSLGNFQRILDARCKSRNFSLGYKVLTLGSKEHLKLYVKFNGFMHMDIWVGREQSSIKS